MINIELVKTACVKLFPRSRIKEFLPFFDETFEFGGIKDVDEAAFFIGQIGVECAGFTDFEENLNYSAARLPQVWDKRFRMPRSGESQMEIFPDKMRNPFFYERQPQKLANFVYASRNGNRDEKSGDGWRFRGRGPKQLTGAANFLMAQRALNKIEKFRTLSLIKNPDLVLTPEIGLYTACWFWKSNNLSSLVPKDNAIRRITYKVNGGYFKLEERIQLSNKALALLA